jgi:hypothetical protein
MFSLECEIKTMLTGSASLPKLVSRQGMINACHDVVRYAYVWAAWAVWAVSIPETNVVRHMATPQTYVLQYSVNYTM